jgi:exopolysaccharide biosynthesis polyprenyl glycosylphosphotransferase
VLSANAVALGIVAIVMSGHIAVPLAALVAVACLATVAGLGNGRVPIELSITRRIPYLLRSIAIAGIIVLPLLAFTSEPVIAVELAATAIAVVVATAAAYAVLRAARRRGKLIESVLFVGSDETSRLLIQLLGRRTYGLDVVAVIDDPDGAEETSSTSSSLSDLPALTDALSVTRVVIASSVPPSRERVAALRSTVRSGVRVHLMPPFGELALAPGHPDIDVVAGIPLYRVPTAVPGGLRWAGKRALDVVVATALLAVLAPVILAAALGTKLSSRGPVLYRQLRVGRDGNPFTMYKLRTFPADHVDDRFSTPHSECPLPLGRVLRRTSIDELPQLVNVLRGEMSLVGPRPERPHFAAPLADSIDGYADRHRVPGGLTGLAQVSGYWGETSIEERVRLDNRYIDDWTLWGDIMILVRTPSAIFRKSFH